MTTYFVPMKAQSASINIKNISYPVLASFKIDGIRGTVQDGKLLSASMKLIPNKYAQERFGLDELAGLDGELVVGPPNTEGLCRRTMSGLMSVDGCPDVRFYVFDALRIPPLTRYPQWAEEFTERLKHAGEIIKRSKQAGKFCVLLEHVLLQNEAELLAYEAKALAMGYEGLMLRKPSGSYKSGPNRATFKEGTIAKLKRFLDSEMSVISVEEGMINCNEAKESETGRSKRSSHKEGMRPSGMVGCLIGKDCKTGQEIRVSAGKMTAEDRVFWWLHRAEIKGKIVKYKFFPSGGKDLPRHPTFQGFRDPRDMTK